MSIRAFVLLAALALALAAATAFAPGVLGAPGSPLAENEPGPPSIERCITPEIVQRDIDAALEEIGNPPMLIGLAPLRDGILVRYWIVGRPVSMAYAFEDGCLTGQFPMPPPM